VRTALIGGISSAALVSLALVAVGPASGIPTATNLYTQSFTGASAAGVGLPQAPDAAGDVNSACLTAGINTAATPVPGCALSTPDAVDSGALRLTSATDSEEGGVFYNTSFPTQEGLDISFNSYQYGGTGADGIGFILAAADPTNPAPPTAIGGPGGALGYTANSEDVSGSGLSDGYLGAALDVYGNYTNSADDGTGCSADPSWVGVQARVPGQVTVRGPGNAAAGYCPLTSTAASDDGVVVPLEGTTRANSLVPVEVAINPSNAAVAMQENTSVSVPAEGYALTFKDLSGVVHTLSGPLPSTVNGGIQPGTIPNSWLSSAGIPDQLTFGWVASTGGANDVHEVSVVSANTISGAPVLFGLTNTDSESGRLIDGAPATWSLGASTLSTGSAETQNVSLSDTFPAGVSLTAASGSGWICSIAGQNVSCVRGASATNPIAAGTSLPAVQVTGNVNAAVGAALDSTATVSSADGNPAQATDDAVVVSTPTMTGQADALSLSASLLGKPLLASVVVHSTAAVSTTASSSTPTPCVLNPSIPDVLNSGDVCAGVTTDASSATSTASASIANVAIGLPTLPAIVIQGVQSTSSTSCSGSSGSTTIAYLKIGTTVLISKPTAIAPNTLLSVGAISLALNQQTPITTPDKGLTVNAVRLTVNALGLAQVSLVVASSESDIGGCPPARLA
jgi:hypothetical protein